MDERKKLAEAKYFYERMGDIQANKTYFEYYLSVFLSSSRSIMQYALEEAKNTTGGKNWYDSLTKLNNSLSI